MRSRAFLEKAFSNWPAKIISVALAVMLFLFYRISSLEERYFSVPLHVMVDDSFVATDISAQSVRVNIRGPADEIYPILENDIQAYADLTDHKSEGQFRAPVQLKRTGTAEHADVEITVDPVEVVVALEKKVTRSVDVAPDITGFPANGYELAQYFVTPKVIEVQGPKSAVEKISKISTEAIDLTGRDKDFTAHPGLVIPNSAVSIVGADTVEFQGVVKQSVVLKSFASVDIILLDLSPELTPAGALPTGSVGVQGKQLQLEAVTPDQITLTVECGTITTPGTYTLPVQPSVPSGVTVLSFTPKEVSVVIAANQPVGEGQ